MSNSSQLRGVHQALVTYSNSNKNWFAGLDTRGQDAGVTVEERFYIMLDGDFFTPGYIVSPYEDDPTISEWPGSGVVTSRHYSFALLQIPPKGERRAEWSQTLNSQAVVVADRNTGTSTSTYGYHNARWTSKTTFGCTHGQRQPYVKLNHWVGHVVWNDNAHGFETTDTLSTVYGITQNAQDKLFSASGDDDAYLIHSGN